MGRRTFLWSWENVWRISNRKVRQPGSGAHACDEYEGCGLPWNVVEVYSQPFKHRSARFHENRGYLWLHSKLESIGSYNLFTLLYVRRSSRHNGLIFSVFLSYVSWRLAIGQTGAFENWREEFQKNFAQKCAISLVLHNENIFDVETIKFFVQILQVGNCLVNYLKFQICWKFGFWPKTWSFLLINFIN